MSESDKNKRFEEYSERTHVIGRICDTITLILLVGAPLIMISVVFCLVPALSSATSFMIMPCGALATGLSWLKYRRESE